MVIEAGSELTLTAGGSFITITPAGVSLSGPGVRLNAGGSPGRGSGTAAKPPSVPDAAAMDISGKTLHIISPEALVKQRRTFLQATSGLCEVCESAKEGAGQS